MNAWDQLGQIVFFSIGVVLDDEIYKIQTLNIFYLKISGVQIERSE